MQEYWLCLAKQARWEKGYYCDIIRPWEATIMDKTLHKIIPTLPGVYFFKNVAGCVVYIGKAKSLRHRVHSYFQKHKADWKVDAILAEYHDLDFIVTKNETEAMLLEAELIQQYKPQFNTMFKDGQPFVYILFTNEKLPRIKLVRNKKQKGSYVGPFLQKVDARNVYHFIVNMFRLNVCNKSLANGCLDYHLGTCPGTCKPDFDVGEYLFRLEIAKDVLKQKDKAFVMRIKEKIRKYNQVLEFEQSKRLNAYLENVAVIFEAIRTKYAKHKFADDIFVATTPTATISQLAPYAGDEVCSFLGLSGPVSTIDCFDISHFQSRYIVGSCVRFTDGKPDKNKFRRFKIKTLTEQNDYAALQEIVTRRYKDPSELPDLILIDGGKGQLSAIRAVLPQAEIISLAKREERLFSKKHKDGVVLDVKTDVGKLLIALRDYAHHFAISYHRLKRRKELTL